MLSMSVFDNLLSITSGLEMQGLFFSYDTTSGPFPASRTDVMLFPGSRCRQQLGKEESILVMSPTIRSSKLTLTRALLVAEICCWDKRYLQAGSSWSSLLAECCVCATLQRRVETPCRQLPWVSAKRRSGSGPVQPAAQGQRQSLNTTQQTTPSVLAVSQTIDIFQLLTKNLLLLSNFPFFTLILALQFLK